LPIMLWTATSNCLAQSYPIVADHNAVQHFDKIPDNWLTKAKELTVHYATTSHGTQVLAGLKNIESAIHTKYSVAITTTYRKADPRLPRRQVPAALRICKQGAHPDDYWEGKEAINGTRVFAQSGIYNFSIFMWCGEHASYSDAKIQEYLHTLHTFEENYPNMRFIYATGIAGGRTAELHNAMIRKYAIANKKVLFDVEDIERYDLAGNYYPKGTSNCEWCFDWCDAHPEDCQDLLSRCESGRTDCCPHSHGLNCRNKAKAFWWMMARLAGWDGQSETETGSANLNFTHPDKHVYPADFMCFADYRHIRWDDQAWNLECPRSDFSGTAGEPDGIVDLWDFSVIAGLWLGG
jgi:hypothetical protein